MKELQAGIQLVRTKWIQLNRHPVKRKALKPVQVSDRQKPLLSLPARSHLEVIRQRAIEGLRRLESQAERINQLSAELKAAVFEFKAIASEVNRDWKAFQATQEPAKNAMAKGGGDSGALAAERSEHLRVSAQIADICEYQAVNVPNVQQKPSGSFILTSQTVDLFKAEREATLLAQTLRHRARKKRLKD